MSFKGHGGWVFSSRKFSDIHLWMCFVLRNLRGPKAKVDVGHDREVLNTGRWGGWEF